MGAVTEILTTYASPTGWRSAELVTRARSIAARASRGGGRHRAANPRLNAVIHKLYDMGAGGGRSRSTDARPSPACPICSRSSARSWKGAPNTNSSFYLKDVAPFDAEVVTRIKKAGFLLVGKSNAPENGWCISTEPKLYGATAQSLARGHDRRRLERRLCAAVAARMVPVAESSDAAGSIRVPASCCGVIGLKPSRGRVTMAPMPILARLRLFSLQLAHGARHGRLSRRRRRHLPGDPYTPPVPAESWLALSAPAPEKLRIGFTVTPPDGSPIHPEVRRPCSTRRGVLEGLGHRSRSTTWRSTPARPGRPTRI